MPGLSWGALYLEDIERLARRTVVPHKDGGLQLVKLTDKDRFLYVVLCVHKQAKTGKVRIANARLAELAGFTGSPRPDGRQRYKGLELSIARLHSCGLIRVGMERGGRVIWILRPDGRPRTYPQRPMETGNKHSRSG